MSEKVTYAAQGYWLRACEISRIVPSVRTIFDAGMAEYAMDLCVELEHHPFPEWLKQHAKQFAQNRHAVIAQKYQTIL